MTLHITYVSLCTTLRTNITICTYMFVEAQVKWVYSQHKTTSYTSSYSPVIPVPSCHLTYKIVEGTGLIHCVHSEFTCYHYLCSIYSQILKPLQEERGTEMEIYSDLSLDETYLVCASQIILFATR